MNFTAVNPPIRTLIIGTGGIAHSHAAGFQAQQHQFAVEACVDIDSERAQAFAARYSIPRHFSDVATALRAVQPSFVTICTPPKPHLELSLQALAAGCDVMCEKPLCASLAECDRLQAAERQTGRFCASVFQFRYAPSTRHVNALLQSGELGRPLVAICNTVWYRDAAYYDVPWRGKWSTELGGPTMGHGIHAMDHLLSLLGPWVEVSAFAATLDRPIEVEDVSVALIRFANGALATVVNSILSPRQETYLRLDCQQATVELTHHYAFDASNWSITPKAGNWDPPARVPASAITNPRWQFPANDAVSNHGTQLAVLADNIRQRTVPLSAGAEARRTIELLTAIYKSAYTKQPVAAGSIVAGDPFYARINGGNLKSPT
jgi:predicted dehydrogenase